MERRQEKTRSWVSELVQLHGMAGKREDGPMAQLLPTGSRGTQPEIPRAEQHRREGGPT